MPKTEAMCRCENVVFKAYDTAYVSLSLIYRRPLWKSVLGNSIYIVNEYYPTLGSARTPENISLSP